MFKSLLEDDFGNVTDGEPAERYWAHSYADRHRILFDPREGKFFQYHGITGAWTELTRATLIQALGERFIVCAERLKDYGFLKRKTEFGRLMQITKQLEGVVERVGAFEGPHKFIHCKSTMIGVDATEAAEYEFSPDYYSRNPLPIDPDFSGPPERFLRDLVIPAMDPDDVALLQKFFGMIITQDNLAQRFLILTGQAGRGKTTLVSIAKLLIGETNTREMRTKHLNDRFEIGMCISKTLLFGSDVEGKFLQRPGAEAIKKMVGGDPLSVEFKGVNGSYEVDGRWNVVITCNERLKVRIQGDVGAWERRLTIIPFEGPKPKKRIPDLARLLFKEEGPRILAWAIKGAQMLHEDLATAGDIILTDTQRERVANLLDESRSMELFMRDEVEPASGFSLTKEEVQSAYQDYCGEHGWEGVDLATQRAEFPALALRIHGKTVSNSIERWEGSAKRTAKGWRGLKLVNPTKGAE